MKNSHTEDLERMTRLASCAGQTWTTRVRAELKRDGRRASGMWPGTVSEARALTEELVKGASPPIGRKSPVDADHLSLVDVMARTLYAAARREWAQWRESEPMDAADEA